MAIKGILWGIVFFFTAIIYFLIPTYLIVEFWAFLATLEIEGQPVYTYAMMVFILWTITLIIGLIYVVAMLRAFIQRKNDDLGIPKGVKGFGLVSVLFFGSIFIIWYLLFNELAFFSLKAP
ncbi:MAG: hypothetical protein ACP6IY_10315 [Promethearchaeia archaeon]